MPHKRDPYHFEITLKMGPPLPKIPCCSCSRDVGWVRWQQQQRINTAAYKFFKRPVCEWCQGQAFNTRKYSFDDGTHHKRAALSKRKAHDHMIEWQMWVIYLEMLLSDLKQEIFIQSRLARGLKVVRIEGVS